MKKKYFITGATGFIGSNIVRKLIANGDTVQILARSKKLNWRLSDLKNSLEIYEGDILSPKLDQIIKRAKPDIIFHFAAYGVLSKENDQRKIFDVNLRGTMNLVNAIKKYSFRLFINAGSAVEYGVKDHSISETDLLQPINDYGVSKGAATLFCQKEAIRNNLPIITFRHFTPFGYFEDRTRLIPDVILSAIEDKPIKVSVPTSVRDFIFIEDIVDAYINATKIKLPYGEIINIGSGKQHSVGEIVRNILNLTKSRSKIEWGAVKKQERYIESKLLQADISKAYKILKWRPKYTINTALKKNIEWFKQNISKYKLD